jgi:hypothetical protein
MSSARPSQLPIVVAATTDPTPIEGAIAAPPPDLAVATPAPLFEAVTTVVPLPSAVVSAPSGDPPSASAGAGREAIAAYFRESEKYDDMGGGDPQEFANSLMKSVTSGDYSGFDALLTKARQQRDHLRGVKPPAACAEHYRLATSLSDDSVRMLERLRSSLKGGDPTGLMSMMGEARAMEARLNELKALTASIKTTAGIS